MQYKDESPIHAPASPINAIPTWATPPRRVIDTSVTSHQSLQSHHPPVLPYTTISYSTIVAIDCGSVPCEPSDSTTAHCQRPWLTNQNSFNSRIPIGQNPWFSDRRIDNSVTDPRTYHRSTCRSFVKVLQSNNAMVKQHCVRGHSSADFSVDPSTISIEERKAHLGVGPPFCSVTQVCPWETLERGKGAAVRG